MHYPVDVFIGKIRDYDGSRPSAIAKVQIDGELMLTELGLAGDQQAEKKIHGGPDRALCHYPREHYADWIRQFPEQATLFCAPAFGENLSTNGMTEHNVFIGDIYRWGEVLIRSLSRALHALNLISTLPSATWPSLCRTAEKPAGCIGSLRQVRSPAMRRWNWRRV